MTDMQEIPPNDEKEGTTPAEPLGLELPLLSGLPIQAVDSELGEDSFLQDAFKTAGIRGLLPKALAEEERTARLRVTRARRSNGIALTSDEIRDDLSKIISHLITQLSTHTAGVSVVLKLPAQALFYVERTAFYAIKDYPRTFENDMSITALWDALEHIYRASIDWRKDEKRGDGRAVIVSIDRLVKAAIRTVYSASDDDLESDANGHLDDPEHK